MTFFATVVASNLALILFLGAVISQTWPSARRFSPCKSVILTFYYLLSFLMHCLLLIFLRLFKKLYTSGKIAVRFWLYNLKIFVFQDFNKKALKLILGEISLCLMWALLIYIFGKKKGLKFCFCFNLNALLNCFFLVLEFSASLL